MAMGISIASDMPSDMKKSIAQINRALKVHFRSTFIYPIEDAHLDVNDSSMIHFTPGTQQRIVRAILKRASTWFNNDIRNGGCWVNVE
jgi:hypothetical protein